MSENWNHFIDQIQITDNTSNILISQAISLVDEFRISTKDKTFQLSTNEAQTKYVHYDFLNRLPL